MRKCLMCGVEYDTDIKYCPKCGKPLLKSTGSSPYEYGYGSTKVQKKEEKNTKPASRSSGTVSSAKRTYGGKRILSFYERGWFILLCLICCWPLAIVFLGVRLYRDQMAKTTYTGIEDSPVKEIPIQRRLTNKGKLVAGIALGITGLLFCGTALASSGLTMYTGLVLGASCIVGGALPIYSSQRTKKLSAMYESLIDNRGNTSIHYIAQQTNSTDLKVRTAIQELINGGFLSEPKNGIGAYISGQHNLVVVTKDGSPIVPIEKTLKELEQKQNLPDSHKDQLKITADTSIEDRLFITIQQSLANIYDPEISEDLNKIGKSVIQIKALLEEDPSQENKQSIRNLRSTYIPKTIEMIEKYLKSSTSEHTKEQIKEMFSTVVTAFENIVDEIQEKDEMDTEISMEVLKKTFERDGLLSTDFDFKL